MVHNKESLLYGELLYRKSTVLSFLMIKNILVTSLVELKNVKSIICYPLHIHQNLLYSSCWIRIWKKFCDISSNKKLWVFQFYFQYFPNTILIFQLIAKFFFIFVISIVDSVGIDVYMSHIVKMNFRTLPEQEIFNIWIGITYEFHLHNLRHIYIKPY